MERISVAGHKVLMLEVRFHGTSGTVMRSYLYISIILDIFRICQVKVCSLE